MTFATGGPALTIYAERTNGEVCTEKINLSKLVNRLSNQTSFGLSN